MKLNKAMIKQTFAVHPQAESVTQTQDGNLFIDPNHAAHHASKKGHDEKPLTITRENFALQTMNDKEEVETPEKEEAAEGDETTGADEAGKKGGKKKAK